MAEGPTMPEQLVWRALRGEVAAGRPCVLAVVVSHEGSSPGHAGWLMAIGPDGWLAGTTGGGLAEVAVVEAALHLLTGSAPSPRLLTQTHRPGAEHASGLRCGGEQVVALVPVDASWARRLEAVDAALSVGETLAWQVTGDGWSFDHVSGPTHRVVLVGAGHVGEALARLLVPLGFRVEVVDERPGAAARLRGLVHGAREMLYGRLAEVVPPGATTLVVVATHDPDRDAAAVAALEGVRVGYLGLVGKRARIAHLPHHAEVEVPAGLPMGGHSPAEVAVSVAARLVAVRAGVPGSGRQP